MLIARVTGTSQATFLRERLFGPLGMKDTGFHVPEAKLDRLPTCYGRDYATGEIVGLHEAHGGFFARPPAFESGGGGLVSTVDDLFVFGRMLLDRGVCGSERILSRPSVKLMTMDHLTLGQKTASPLFDENFWNNHGWGFGMAVTTARRDLAGEPGRFGWDGACSTSWFVDPQEQMVGVFLTQRRPDMLNVPRSSSISGPPLPADHIDSGLMPFD